MENAQKFRCIFYIELHKIIEKSEALEGKDLQKIILIKIGNSSIKCKNLNETLTLTTEALYSKTSSNFHPLKGIIKVYDITKQGNQIISCVGAFNTDDLLFLEGSQKMIAKDVGPIILELNIRTVIEKISWMSSTENEDSINALQSSEQLSSSNHSNSHETTEHNFKELSEIQQNNLFGDRKDKPSDGQKITKQEKQDLQQKKIKKNSEISQSNSSSNPSLIQKLEDAELSQKKQENKLVSEIKKQNFIKSKEKKIQNIQIQSDNYSRGLSQALGVGQKSSIGEQSSIRDKSANVSMSSLTFHELYDEYEKGELSLIGEQLVAERRNNKLLEERLQKMQLKIESYKKKVGQAENFMSKWNQKCENFLNILAVDSYGDYLIEFSARKQTITFKLSKNQKIGQYPVLELLNFMNDSIKSQTKIRQRSHDKSITEKIQNVYEQNIDLRNQIYEHQQTINSFKKKYELLNQKLSSTNSELNQKNEQIFALELKHSQISQSLKAIEGMNSYLKEKDQQMEYIISTKQNTIDNLRKMLTGANNELDELEDQNIHLKKTLRNCELMIEELKEEIANRDDTLEMYEQKYGTIKFQKNRELENQINDCLRWISQESKLMHESLEETQRSDITMKKDRTLSSIVKNNDKLYGLGIDQVERIREQLSGLIEQVDQFHAKLSEENELKESIISQKSVLVE